MKRRDFIKGTAAFASIMILPSSVWANTKNGKLHVAAIGVGGRGKPNLMETASHPMVEITALCDVDSNNLAKAHELYPKARTFADYRVMFDKMGKDIDAVLVSTPDHTHAPASMAAMQMGKPVYCEKPLTHHVSESRSMRRYAEENNIITQMGIQCHSSAEYRMTVELIQQGIVGKVNTVLAWSPKNWGYDGPAPEGSDVIPATLDWNLWLGTSPKRAYKKGYYHPANWRKILDYGCGTLGDMGVHIFDTPYTALELNVPRTVRNECRKPTGFGHPENNIVTYEFPGTKYTAKTLKWVWYDGPGSPKKCEELILPDGDKLPEQGAMFIGEKGRLLLPHWEVKPSLIVNGKYEKIDYPEMESEEHHHQFVNACLGKGKCSASFSYAARLTEAMLLGVVANRFPNELLHWNIREARFKEKVANKLLDFEYRKF